MSQPYVYVPEANFYQTAYYQNGQSPYGSPFVPNVNLQGASPYSNPASLPPSPHHGYSHLPPGGLLFPTMTGGADPLWDSGYRRPRQNSWHGVNPTGLLSPGGPNPGHFRSNSFGQSDPPFFPNQAYYGQPPPATAPINTNWSPNSHSPWFNRFLSLGRHEAESQMHIHPWLNGEAFRNDFIFNLSIPTFAPMRIVGPRGETALLAPDELGQVATYPHLHKLTITCDKLPQFPIELVFNPMDPAYAMRGTANLPPILVGDILATIHRELHKGITQYDWGGLSSKEELEVSRAYVRRCRSSGPQAEMALRSAGVKKVDFLLKDVMFKGLVRSGEGLEHLKMVTGPA
ncbi:hypothetical protein D9611_009126 [Ephemerocybe angulata]|uniref:DUF6699 domain-containing protein n=1 Tax=Ephemerocybe angulata TaxID=980116 RepID=A0A8H5FKE4_9AGAR|nr:hypothetical protein D9611_009126 [Tulosesus angulatus]